MKSNIEKRQERKKETNKRTEKKIHNIFWARNNNGSKSPIVLNYPMYLFIVISPTGTIFCGHIYITSKNGLSVSVFWRNIYVAANPVGHYIIANHFPLCQIGIERARSQNGDHQKTLKPIISKREIACA